MAAANDQSIRIGRAMVSNYHLVKPGQPLDHIRDLYGDDFLNHPHNIHVLGTGGPLLPGMRLRV